MLTGTLESNDRRHKVEVVGRYDDLPGRRPDYRGWFRLPADVLERFALSQPCRLTIEGGPDIRIRIVAQQVGPGSESARVEFMHAGEPG